MRQRRPAVDRGEWSRRRRMALEGPSGADRLAGRFAANEARRIASQGMRPAERNFDRYFFKRLMKRTCAREQIMHRCSRGRRGNRCCGANPGRERRTRIDEPADSSRGGRDKRGQDQGARRRPVADRTRLRQGLDHAARQEPAGGRDRDGVDRIARARHRARRRRSAARPGRRNLRARIVRQDDAHSARDRGSAEEGRRLRLRRRRACARPRLCEEARRQSQRSADFPARHRRTGARNHRHAGALGRDRRPRHRLGRGADARGPKSKARWANPSRACRRG